VTVSLSQLSPDALEFDARDAVLAHTAAELRTHMARGPRDERSPVAVRLSAGSGASDGFAVTVEDDAIRIAGDSPRGTVNGASWLLEALGFRWVRPGESGVRLIPGRTLAAGAYRESPAFPRRTLILGNDALHDDWFDWLEFASRNRMNSLFLHDTPPSVLDRHGAARPGDADGLATDGKGWMFERWDADGEAILRECARRGVSLQFGGHHLPGLLPRGQFSTHPDWFPMRDGARDGRYNLCTSSAGAITEVRARAREFFARFAGADVYHLWADDIVGGGWCACPDSAPLTPSDQAQRATNLLAVELAAVRPGAAIAHLAYHDTIAPPRVFRPERNVSALYAPRNRNYAFAINDASCARNHDGHYAELLGLAETFRGHPLAAFEYYSDAILYKWMDPPNLAVLPADAVAYRQAGVSDFGNLAVTPRPWVGPMWHAWWFARCAWNARASADVELPGFCAAAFGESGPQIERLYRSLDSGYRKLLDLGAMERIPRHDVLDFSDTPREALTVKAHQLSEAAAEMNGAVADLAIVPAGLGPEFRQDLAVQLAFINHLDERINAWEAALAGRSAEASARLERARFHLRALRDWDAVHAGPAYANLSRRMLQGAGYYTERIGRLLS
jgi:hypothetical protein